MKKTKPFLLYPNQWEALCVLNHDQLGRLLEAIFMTIRSKDSEKVIDGLDEDIIIAYKFLMLQINIDNEKYEKAVKNRRERQRRFVAKQKLTNVNNGLPIKDKEKDVEVEVEVEVDGDGEADGDNEEESISSIAAADNNINIINNNQEGSAVADPDSAAWQQNFIKYFNECIQGSKIPRIRGLTGERLEKVKQLRSLIQQTPGALNTGEVFRKAARSPFLNGQGAKNKFQATFDWLIEPENYFRVMEGNYDAK